MIHRALLLASALMLTTQLRADSCVSEKAAVNQLRQWVVFDLPLQRSTLSINVAKLNAAIELLGQCEHIDLRAALPIIRDFANSLCITPPLEQRSTQLELSGDAKVKFDAVLEKLAGIDVGGAAKYIVQQSRGLLQSDLAKAIKDNNDCKVGVFAVLLAKLADKPPHYHTELSDEKTTFCTVYMHQPSDNTPCSNCTGHCTAPDGGTVTRFIKRDCDGPGCGHSYHPNPQQGYNPDVDISQDGHSIVWRRRYDDASPQTEKYYFGYKTPTQVCDENCPQPNR